MTSQPKLSIALPYHDTPKTAAYLSRLFDSLSKQTFTDYEIVLVKGESMGQGYNEAIRRSKGEIIHCMGIDDYYAHPFSLQSMVNAFDENTMWAATGCLHDNDGEITYPHLPKWNDKLYTGENSIGGFSVLLLRNHEVPRIDEDLHWMIDCDFYWRLYQKYGEPKTLETIDVIVRWNEHQTTNTLSDEQKLQEVNLVTNRYAN